MIVELKNIYKNYGDGEAEVRVLKDVTMSVREGEYLAVMGPSGSGKSTLMNILGCLDRPTSGTYLLDGQDVSSLSENELASVRLNKIGFVFQTFQLLPGADHRYPGALQILIAAVGTQIQGLIEIHVFHAVCIGCRCRDLTGGDRIR